MKVVFALFLCLAAAQQIGTQQAENHPGSGLRLSCVKGPRFPRFHPALPTTAFTTYTCDATGTCAPETSEIVLDANWRWLNKVGTYTNCYTGARAFRRALLPRNAALSPKHA
jgi:cellulose 1,4-beta-cellobiosidase